MQDAELRDRWARLMRLLGPEHARARTPARRLCRSAAEGDDLFQDAVVRAHRKLHTLRDEERFRAWFYAVLLSVHRNNWWRHFWRRFLHLEDVVSRSAEPAGEDGWLRAEQELRAERAARALARLPAVQREAVVLHDVDGFSMEAIAAMQGVTVSAVKSRVVRGRERLRRHYERRNFGARAPRGRNVDGLVIPETEPLP